MLMPSRRLAITTALWLALFGLTLALSSLTGVHDTLPGDLGITTWAQDIAFPGETLSGTIRAVTSTEVVLGTGAAVALILWVRGYRLQATLLAVGLVLLPLLQAGIKKTVGRRSPMALRPLLTVLLAIQRAGQRLPGRPLAQRCPGRVRLGTAPSHPGRSSRPGPAGAVGCREPLIGGEGSQLVSVRAVLLRILRGRSHEPSSPPLPV